MDEDRANWPPVDPIRSGIAGRCPRCGEGRLFAGYLALKKECANCRLDYSFADSADGPAVFVMLIVGFLVVGLALWVEVNWNPPLWLHFGLWIPLTIAVSLWPLRMLKGVMVNLQYANQAREGRIEGRE